MCDDNGPLRICEEVVIAGGEEPRHRAWPALEVTTGGELVVIYKEGSDHHRTDDGAILLKRSRDGGHTWSPARALAALPGWRCFTNHALGKLSDGTLLAQVIQARHLPGPRSEMRRAFTRSSDGGPARSSRPAWSELGANIEPGFAEPTAAGAAYGHVHELSDGRLMSAYFGVPRGAADAKLRVAGVVFSADGGRSWPEAAVIYEDRQGDICPSETDIIRLADGRYLAMMRANAALRLYRSTSADEGRTWSPITPTELPGQCPALLTLASGQLLCAYRDMRPEQPGMSCAVSDDNGETWRVLGYLYKGANVDCAYPSMVHLGDGSIICAFYTAASPEAITGSSEIHGLILEDRSAR